MDGPASHATLCGQSRQDWAPGKFAGCPLFRAGTRFPHDADGLPIRAAAGRQPPVGGWRGRWSGRRQSDGLPPLPAAGDECFVLPWDRSQSCPYVRVTLLHYPMLRFCQNAGSRKCRFLSKLFRPPQARSTSLRALSRQANRTPPDNLPHPARGSPEPGRTVRPNGTVCVNRRRLHSRRR